MIKNHIEHIVFYDGICGLCNEAVQFIIKHDRKTKFHFCAIQNSEAFINKELISTANSLVLFEKGKYYFRSDAVLRIIKQLNSPWYLLYFFIIVPKVFRDNTYDFIANNRYKWFGKFDTCIAPDEKTRDRFLS
ncbi:MAG: DCC1-like thiol-disulfide oxidoreductase family protein [Bacteroidota bacterium]